jgi:hypothetical protein
MVVEDNVLPELLDELVRTSDYRRRRREIAEFNTTSPVLKRGLALTCSRDRVHPRPPNQAGAIVHVYTDGSVSGTTRHRARVNKGRPGRRLFLGCRRAVRSTATDNEKVRPTL